VVVGCGCGCYCLLLFVYSLAIIAHAPPLTLASFFFPFFQFYVSMFGWVFAALEVKSAICSTRVVGMIEKVSSYTKEAQQYLFFCTSHHPHPTLTPPPTTVRRMFNNSDGQIFVPCVLRSLLFLGV
jgi:hypothetical protein